VPLPQLTSCNITLGVQLKPMELSLIWSHILRECLSSLLSVCVCVGVDSEKCKYYICAHSRTSDNPCFCIHGIGIWDLKKT
jgi:hypothetical protein